MDKKLKKINKEISEVLKRIQVLENCESLSFMSVVGSWRNPIYGRFSAYKSDEYIDLEGEFFKKFKTDTLNELEKQLVEKKVLRDLIEKEIRELTRASSLTNKQDTTIDY